MHEFETVAVLIVSIAIPVVAIIGGITLAIVRTRGQQKLAELERRERIAAIERGVNPATLPSQISAGGYDNGNGSANRLRRAHGLMIGGFVTVAAGIALMALLGTSNSGDRDWAVGLFPFLIGLALLLSSRIVWPRDSK